MLVNGTHFKFLQSLQVSYTTNWLITQLLNILSSIGFQSLPVGHSLRNLVSSAMNFMQIKSVLADVAEQSLSACVQELAKQETALDHVT